jgi:hypothetical protein
MKYKIGDKVKIVLCRSVHDPTVGSIVTITAIGKYNCMEHDTYMIGVPGNFTSMDDDQVTSIKTDPVRISTYNKFQGHCAYCGKYDHIIPKRNFHWHIKNKFRVPDFLKHLTEFDCNHPDNLFPTCRVCNNWKNTHCLEDFRKELQEQVPRLNLRSANYRIAKKYFLIKETLNPIIFYFEEYWKNKSKFTRK